MVDVDAIKAFVEEVEYIIEHPEATIQEITGLNITAIVEDAISFIPDEKIKLDVYGYLPMLDFFGPFAFLPSHCYGDS